MKLKIGVAALVIVLVALQLIFGGRKADAPAPTSVPAPVPEEFSTFPAPGEVTRIGILTSAPKVSLSDSGDTGRFSSYLFAKERGLGWTGTPPSFSASEERIERFLTMLLAGDYSPVPSTIDPGAVDLDGFGSVNVFLYAEPADSGTFTIGLHPEGDFDSTYVKMPDGRIVLADGDLRGELGLWENRPGAKFDPLVWLDTRVLRFDPEQVVSLAASYPDHEIAFARGEEGWTMRPPEPGGRWSEAGFRAWLADLADFRITGIAPAPGPEERWTHSIALGFADGSEKTIRVEPSHAGGDAIAVLSDHFGKAFVLPNWRFEEYFNRLDSLFPNAVPRFAPEDVQLLDVRHGGESVKITRRDGGWEPVALPYAAKAEAAERLARFLAAWRPEDYADADAKTARPVVDAATVEAILAGGAVHQYRLSGRHPVFPWRYVTLDGERVFSVTDAEAEVMFPGFAEILELGTVFPEREDVSAYALEDVAAGKRIRIVRDGGGDWTAEDGERSMPLAAVEAEALAGELGGWRVTGFHQPVADAGAGSWRVTLAGEGGEAGITLFQPVGRDIPYATDGEEYFRIDRVKFHNWLASVRDIGRRLEEYAPTIAEPEPEPEPAVAPEPEPEPEPAVEQEPEPAPAPEPEPEPAPAPQAVSEDAAGVVPVEEVGEIGEAADIPLEAPVEEPPARKIVQEEIGFSGTVAGKAAAVSAVPEH